MTKKISWAAFLLGFITVAWMGTSFISTNLLALIVTLIIGFVYAVGFWELVRYQRATDTLFDALAPLSEKVTSLDEWIGQLHQSLHNAVRLRIEGEHIGLPAPVVTPYLVGLLVMLGLLGTFIGMVETLEGAVMALEGTTELEAIRAGLAAPIKGLGMAFGTSVAGISASAMLGFISTISRRDRMLASRQLDSKVGTVFQDFSLSYNRQQTYKAMQMQAEALPQVAQQLTVLAEKLEHMSEDISEQLITNQNRFHESAQLTYTELAKSVEESLKESLAESGRLAGESIQPAVEEIMTGIGNEARLAHQQFSETAQQQLEAVTKNFANTAEDVAKAWQSGLEAHQQSNERLTGDMSKAFDGFSQQFENATSTLLDNFNKTSTEWLQKQQSSDEQRLATWTTSFENITDNAQLTSGKMLEEITRLMASSENLVQTRIETEAKWIEAYDGRMNQLASTLKSELESLREAEEGRGQAAVERLSNLEKSVTEHLATLGNALEEPMTRLIQTASETPRAAAEVIEQLRGEISKNIERDNKLLDERRRIMEELNTLSGSLEQASIGQCQAIEKLVNSSADMLKDVGARFTDHVGSEVVKLSDIVDHFAGSAAELSSLGEAFGLAVQLFNESNTGLTEKLSSIEESLQQTTERSDEQLGYYVAQAREIIDHSMLTQQEMIDQLRQIGKGGAIAEESSEEIA